MKENEFGGSLLGCEFSGAVGLGNRIRAKKNCLRKNTAASRVFWKLFFCSTSLQGAPLWGAHGSKGHGGGERSGTPTVPLARVGRGFAQAIAERRSYSEAFGLWRCACERRKARGGRLEEGAHLRLFIHNIYYFTATGRKNVAP